MPIGRRKEQKELRKKVEKLEAEVELLKRKIGKLDGASKTKTILEIAVLVIELVGAILAIVTLTS